MIDKLCLTVNRPPDKDYMENHGKETVDDYKTRLYKYMYELDRAVVFCYPHKFSDSTNANIPFTKIDINPKYFDYFDHLLSYVLSIFNDPSIGLKHFNISRVDIAADMENLSMDTLLAILNIKKIRSDALNMYKGTIYGGSDPKIRIYDKKKEIKSRLRKGETITEYEEDILDSKKSCIRFEIQIRTPKMTLQELKEKAVSLASYFDRLEFIRSDGNEPQGIMHFLLRLINRKFRKQIEELKNNDLIERIKDIYRSNVIEWFSEKEPF